MSITDELREWAHGFNGPWRRNEEMLLAIADRIDAEHERAVMSTMNDALYHANDESMAELGWVRLPKDADGEPIHIGDVMENLREDLEPQLHHRFRVYSIRYRDYGQGCVLAEDGYPSILYSAEECRHYHEPTVEDVLRECCYKYHSVLIDDMNDAINRVERDYIAPAEIIAEYAARLRLRSDAE